MSEPVVAIVVAAGSGVRLGGSTVGGVGPKALRQLAGVSLVRRSVEALVAGGVDEIIAVIGMNHLAAFTEALAGITVPIRYEQGGASRQESVQRGLAVLPDSCSVVLVHDAARPLVPAQVTAQIVAEVKEGSVAVVPVLPISDSIRVLTGDSSQVVDRATLRAVQTPQGFHPEILKKAHAGLQSAAVVGELKEYTDDAAVCEAVGHQVTLVAGSRLAMKVTEPIDFVIAESLLLQEKG
ncbi:MAG: IspD/TarI family cytidylyltransferase [Propionibacteriaceae bacterium]